MSLGLGCGPFFDAQPVVSDISSSLRHRLQRVVFVLAVSGRGVLFVFGELAPVGCSLGQRPAMPEPHHALRGVLIAPFLFIVCWPFG